MGEIDLAELYPQGRTFYYEGNDPKAFLRLVDDLDLGEPTVQVHVAPEKLKFFYDLLDMSGLKVGT
jgi:hypothetical protein